MLDPLFLKGYCSKITNKNKIFTDYSYFYANNILK